MKSYLLMSVHSCNVEIKFATRSNSYFNGINVITSIRPSIDDIERISYGQAAKRRGVGSRGVPHRLNSDERIQFDLAKKKHFLTLRGSGYRKERADSPLANIYRNYCDAIAIPCISIACGLAGTYDEIVIDFSPLRRKATQDEVKASYQIFNQFSTILNISDETNFAAQGWNEDILLTEPIWRIPVYSMRITVNSRSDSKKIAQLFASETI
eukprot:gene10914-14652_t